MRRRAALAAFLLVPLLLWSSPAAVKKAVFDGQAAWSYIRDLSTDAMMGRKSGHPGGLLGAQYVAAKFKEWGLEPAGPNGAYFQDFPMAYSFTEPGATLQIVTPRRSRTFVYGEDWRPQRLSGAGTFMAPIVFVGYGISAPEKDYDEYAGVDAKGKWVLFSTGAPARFEEKFRDETTFAARIKAAQEHGARGVLTFQSGSPTRGLMPGAVAAARPVTEAVPKDLARPDFVVCSLGSATDTKIVDMLFKDLATELRFLLGQVETTGKPQSFDLGAQAMIKLTVENDEKRVSQNVLAKITGSDPRLRNECVIIGGHMDHLGFDREGDVANGANDNASGTAVAMEIARVMKQSGARPKRTVIFAAWAGEEAGLLGSKHYTENPTVPLEKTVAYINMDMVGHGNGRVRFSGEYYAPEIWALLKAKLPKSLLDYTDPGRGGPGGSDHSHFLYNGVAAFAAMTAGTHFKYHQSGDEIELIKAEMLQKTGDLVLACVDILANEPANIIQPGRREMFWYRYLTLVNYAAVPLDDVLAKRKDVKEPEVDWQLAALSEKAGLAGESLRAELVRTLFTLPDRFRGLSGLGLYGAGAPAGPRGGGSSRTLVLPGLIGANFFQDEPRWLEILGKQGVRFAALDKPDFLFAGGGLSEAGKKMAEAYDMGEVLFFLKGLDDAQAKALLETLKKPVVLLVESLPGQAVLDLVKKNGAALGLICTPDDSATDYVRKLDAAKEAVGRENLTVIIWQDLWESPAQDQVRAVIGEMLKAKYEPNEMQSLFSGTLSRVLARMRAVEGQVRTVVTISF